MVQGQVTQRVEQPGGAASDTGGKRLEGSNEALSLPPLDWGGGKVRLECAFLGKTHRFEHDGPFARIGNDPRCEFCIPGLPAPVCVYLQFGRQYVAVLELVESTPVSMCEPVYAMPGATVWLQPNARITVENLYASASSQDSFSWENFNVDDVRVFPNTLVARSGFVTSASTLSHFRIQSALSVLGSSPSCQLRPEHKHISRFQAIVFRGEHHGESCRVIDLFGEHPTLVDNQIANGSILDVGSQVRIANLQFEAVRMLYNASRPNQLVEVRTQFTTLPLPAKRDSSDSTSKEKGQVPPKQPQDSPETDLQSLKKRVVRAIGFDSGPPQTNRVHFPIEPPLERAASLPEPSAVDPRLADGLERVAKSQERIADEFEKLALRLEGVEKSLVALPEILDNNAQQLADTVESLREAIEQVAKQPNESRDVTHEHKPVAMNPLARTSDAQKQGAHDSGMQAHPNPKTEHTASQHTATAQPKNVKQGDQSAPTRSDDAGAKQQSGRQEKTHRTSKGQVLPNKAKNQQAARQSQPKQSSTVKTRAGEKATANPDSQDSEPTWLQRAATGLSGWIPNTAAHRRAIAQREEPSDPLNLGSQATAKRTRLQHHEDESERLAASESKDETLVLGSLMGLRYRDARKAFYRWLAFGLVLATLSLVGGPLIWKRIPEGWRELLWQKITFAKTPQQLEYEATYGNGSEPSDSKPTTQTPSAEPADSKITPPTSQSAPEDPDATSSKSQEQQGAETKEPIELNPENQPQQPTEPASSANSAPSSEPNP